MIDVIYYIRWRIDRDAMIDVIYYIRWRRKAFVSISMNISPRPATNQLHLHECMCIQYSNPFTLFSCWFSFTIEKPILPSFVTLVFISERKNRDMFYFSLSIIDPLFFSFPRENYDLVLFFSLHHRLLMVSYFISYFYVCCFIRFC
jgi:hypothetical protein